ncbi:MAG: hypothetical protein ACOC44_06360 [Promethearchaeia archaeon]
MIIAGIRGIVGRQVAMQVDWNGILYSLPPPRDRIPHLEILIKAPHQRNH